MNHFSKIFSSKPFKYLIEQLSERLEAGKARGPKGIWKGKKKLLQKMIEKVEWVWDNSRLLSPYPPLTFIEIVHYDLGK